MGQKGVAKGGYRGKLDFLLKACAWLWLTVTQIYMFRLLLEYGRIIDDNRDRIGYSGDGSELDKYDGVTSTDEVAH